MTAWDSDSHEQDRGLRAEYGKAEDVRAVARVLDAAEAASPVEAVEAVTYELGLALDATLVSFLIVDLSGRALVRLESVLLRLVGEQIHLAPTAHPGRTGGGVGAHLL